MTNPMTREQEIQSQALMITYGRLDKDPYFYASKQNMRRNLSLDAEGNECAPPVMIEFDEEDDGNGVHVTVIDNDLTVHVI